MILQADAVSFWTNKLLVVFSHLVCVCILNLSWFKKAEDSDLTGWLKVHYVRWIYIFFKSRLGVKQLCRLVWRFNCYSQISAPRIYSGLQSVYKMIARKPIQTQISIPDRKLVLQTTFLSNLVQLCWGHLFNQHFFYHVLKAFQDIFNKQDIFLKIDCCILKVLFQ